MYFKRLRLQGQLSTISDDLCHSFCARYIHAGTGYGCKSVPKKGYSNDCAANGAWIHQPNGTFTSVMDGQCLTLHGSSSLVVDACLPASDKGSTAQLWDYHPATADQVRHV